MTALDKFEPDGRTQIVTSRAPVRAKKLHLNKILHLSCKINSYKTERVHNHQPLVVPEGISVRVRSISWGEPKFSAQQFLLSLLSGAQGVTLSVSPSVCLLDTKCSIALNLHLSSSDLQANFM